MTDEPTKTLDYRTIQKHIRLANESKNRHNFLDEIGIVERRMQGDRRKDLDRRHLSLSDRIRKVLKVFN